MLPAGWHGPAERCEESARPGVLCRAVSDTACVRFAIGFYNAEDEVGKAATLVRQFSTNLRRRNE